MLLLLLLLGKHKTKNPINFWKVQSLNLAIKAMKIAYLYSAIIQENSQITCQPHSLYIQFHIKILYMSTYCSNLSKTQRKLFTHHIYTRCSSPMLSFKAPRAQPNGELSLGHLSRAMFVTHHTSLVRP